MEKEEIFRYIQVSSSKSISVDRRLLEQYPGIIRNVIIRDNTKLQVDYLDKNVLDLGEGEISLYFYYEDYDKLFNALEDFIGLRMEHWNNYTKTDWYPETIGTELSQSWQKLKVDFVGKTLYIPSGYKKYSIRDLYWEALYNGELKINDPKEIIIECLKRKTL